MRASVGGVPMTGVSRRVGYSETVPSPLRHWSKLPPVSRGFTRIPDDRGRRMVKCDQCGAEIVSLGIGRHLSRLDHGAGRRHHGMIR